MGSFNRYLIISALLLVGTDFVKCAELVDPLNSAESTDPWDSEQPDEDDSSEEVSMTNEEVELVIDLVKGFKNEFITLISSDELQLKYEDFIVAVLHLQRSFAALFKDTIFDMFDGDYSSEIMDSLDSFYDSTLMVLKDERFETYMELAIQTVSLQNENFHAFVKIADDPVLWNQFISKSLLDENIDDIYIAANPAMLKVVIRKWVAIADTYNLRQYLRVGFKVGLKRYYAEKDQEREIETLLEKIEL